jgi:hypothetical protein
MLESSKSGCPQGQVAGEGSLPGLQKRLLFAVSSHGAGEGKRTRGGRGRKERRLLVSFLIRQVVPS